MQTSFFGIQNNVPKETLIRLAPKIERLAGKNIPPESDSPLTEDQIALRKLAREMGRYNRPKFGPSGDKIDWSSVIQFEINATTKNSVNTPVSPGINPGCLQISKEIHSTTMMVLSSWMKKIEILRSSGHIPELT